LSRLRERVVEILVDERPEVSPPQVTVGRLRPLSRGY